MVCDALLLGSHHYTELKWNIGINVVNSDDLLTWMCLCKETQNSETSRLKSSQACQKQLVVAQIHGPCGIVMVWPRLTPSFKPNSATASVQWACHTLLLVLGTMPCTILGSWRFVKSMGNTKQCKIFGKNDGKTHITIYWIIYFIIYIHIINNIYHLKYKLYTI